ARSWTLLPTPRPERSMPGTSTRIAAPPASTSSTFGPQVGSTSCRLAKASVLGPAGPRSGGQIDWWMADRWHSVFPHGIAFYRLPTDWLAIDRHWQSARPDCLGNARESDAGSLV